MLPSKRAAKGGFGRQDTYSSGWLDRLIDSSYHLELVSTGVAGDTNGQGWADLVACGMASIRDVVRVGRVIQLDRR